MEAVMACKRFFNAIFLVLLTAILAACATAPQLPPAPTTAEIVQMSKDGQPADAIIRRMMESRAFYPLPASELAKLREQGVPDRVIDYMQQSYVEAVRYEEWSRARDAWPPFGPYGPYGPYFRGRHYWW
jgi:hypothetical protein